MTRYVTITTTTHPFAITMYAFALILGVGHLIGFVPDLAVEQTVPEALFNLWHAVHFMAPLLMVGGAIAARVEEVPIVSLGAEAIGCALFAATKGIYLVSLTSAYGFAGGPSTQIMSAGLVCACVARAVVIWVELRRIIRKSRQTASLEGTPHRGG